MSPFTKGLLLGISLTLVVTTTAVAIGGKLVWDGLQMARRAMATEAAEAVETKAFPLAGLRRLSASTGVGDVTVEVGDVSEVQVTARRIARADTLRAAQEALPTIGWSAQVVRGRLILRQEATGRREAADSPTGEVKREVHFRVVLPKQAALRVAARTGVGTVSLTGLQEAASGEAGVGDVRVKNVDGPLTLEAGTGDVAIDGGRGPVTAEAGIGTVRVRGHEGNLSLKTGTGDVRADLIKLSGPVEVETGIGNITLAVTRKLDARFVLEPGIGHVENDMPAAKPPEGAQGEQTVLVLGKGTHMVKAGTGTGDIHLQPAD